MTLTFLELYNTAASQEWSMYDGDAANTDEFEKPFVVALNKAVTEILYSYPFQFRKRTQILFTIPNIKSYDVPEGMISKDRYGNYNVKLNNNILKYIENPLLPEDKFGVPESFYISGNQLILYPTPDEKSILTINYLTLAIGENSDGEEIFKLSEEDDVLLIPSHLEEIFKNAVISRTMLNSLASESDENFSAYKKQSQVYYRQLVNYSKGVMADKSIKI